MHESIDSSRKALPARRRNRKLYILVAIIALILFGSRTAVSYWVQSLWFGSLGYRDVFVRQLALQWGIFAAFAVITFCVLYGSFALLNHAHRHDLPLDHLIVFGGREVSLSVQPVLRFIAIAGSVVIGLISGGAMASEWPTLALFWFAPPAAGAIVDPIFGMPLNFFLFTLPAWNLLAGWLLALAVITCLLAGLFILIASGTRAFSERSARYFAMPWRGLSRSRIPAVCCRHSTYLGRFAQLYEHHTIFDGVTYTGAHVTSPALLVIAARSCSERPRCGQRPLEAARHLADRIHRSGGVLLCGASASSAGM